MNALKKFAGAIKRLCASYARHAVDIVSNPVLANYTPTGPGSLATGQAGAAGRSGSYIGSADGATDEQAQNQPKPIEYSLPLRQVFWI